MNESTIRSAAIAHLLPLIDHADMDGLEEDLATGIEPGTGGKLNWAIFPGS